MVIFDYEYFLFLIDFFCFFIYGNLLLFLKMYFDFVSFYCIY